MKSSKNNILFTIKFGEGLFELNSVKYSYYALNLNDLTQFNNNKCYFYTDATKTEIIYSRGATDNVLIRNCSNVSAFNCQDINTTTGSGYFFRSYIKDNGVNERITIKRGSCTYKYLNYKKYRKLKIVIKKANK